MLDSCDKTIIDYNTGEEVDDLIKPEPFKEIIEKIIEQLTDIKYTGDIGDIGNEIGIAIKSYIDEKKEGYELDSFLWGVKHGISLNNNTQ